MEYIVYFAGPFILGVIAATRMRQQFRVFVVGLVAFLAAWIPIQIIATAAGQGLGSAAHTLVYALIVATCAGLFEESARYVAFRRCAVFRGNHNWRSAFVYAVGHHGMETLIVGLNVLLAYLVLRYKPDAVSDPALREQCQALLARGAGLRAYDAVERLSVGLLVHVCFSAVVMLAIVRARRRWLLAAMAWHFGHDMVALNLHRISDHWTVSKVWITIVVIGYSYLAVRLYRALEGHGVAGAERPVSGGRPPMILPGRPAV